MRTQVVLAAIGAGCVALALVFVLREQSARAAEARGAERRAEGFAVAAEAEAREPLVPGKPAATLAESRSPAEEDGSPRSPLGARADVAPELAAGLEAELLRARALGWVGDGELAQFLAQAYLAQGELARAFELVKTYGCDDFGLWWAIAVGFDARGELARQSEVLLAALERWPEHYPLLDQLIQADPAAAAAHLRAMLARQEPPGDPELRGRLARALAAGGGGDEARALVEAMVAENPVDLEAIAMLAEFDPARALALLEAGFAGSEEPEVMRTAMLDILIGTGNPAAAVRVLDCFEGQGLAVEPDEWGMVAEAWLSNGDTASGTAAMQRALACEHGDPDSWVHRLEELAPDALLRELEHRIASDEAHNDEYWGSLADSYWRFGRHADARAAWERAFELDRDDGEWPARLEALRAGRDPYGG